jgi:hypothetical protein
MALPGIGDADKIITARPYTRKGSTRFEQDHTARDVRQIVPGLKF